MEALITIDCSGSLTDVLRMFQKIGWDIYNPQGNIEYLPIDDNDEYDWHSEEISEIELYNIISNKIAKKEQVGVNLFYNKGSEGISFIAYSTAQIMLSMAINRKVVKGRHTDMAWYLENIVYKLLDADVKILSYKLEEFED